MKLFGKRGLNVQKTAECPKVIFSYNVLSAVLAFEMGWVIDFLISSNLSGRVSFNTPLSALIAYRTAGLGPEHIWSAAKRSAVVAANVIELCICLFPW